MYCVQVHKRINQITSLFYRLGLWHRGDEARGKRIKIFYSIFYLLYPISLMAGGIASNDNTESVLSITAAIAISILYVKLLYIVWKEEQIVHFLHCIGVYSVDSHEEFSLISDRVKKFMNFCDIFLFYIIVNGFICVVVAPLVSRFVANEKKLLFNIGFPLDYINSEIAFWVAVLFFFLEVIITLHVISVSVVIWYIMLNCALQYEVLGVQIRNMGVVRTVEAKPNKRNISDREEQKLCFDDLIAAIKSHQHIKKSTDQWNSFISKIFFVQITTSGLSTCGWVYNLAFNFGVEFAFTEVSIGFLIYNLFEIFMITYFGNEIKLSSDRLSYYLFESNWIGQPQSCKKCILILGECLKKSHELVIGKLYPLTLETFTKILRGTYSMFNILKNLQ